MAVDRPGERLDGSILLPNQWSLRPAGKHVLVGDFPSAIAMHPAGHYAAVLHCGYGPHEIVTLDTNKGAVIARMRLDEAFYGIAFSKDGKTLYCSGAGSETIHAFSFDRGTLGEPREFRLRDAKLRGVPAGIAVTADNASMYVANVWGHSLTRLDLRDTNAAPQELALGKRPANAPAPPRASSELDPSTTKRAEQLLEEADAADPFPYACVLDEPRHRLYVSLWAQAAVAVIDLEQFKEIERWKVEEHPNEMLLSRDGSRLFVANANRNSVSVLDPATGKTIETLIAELQPGAEPGNVPNSLALSPDEKQLFVANANINTVAMFDVSAPGKARSLGFIPVGWYPTSVRVTPDGKKLVVANGKGLISKANPNGPKPGRHDVPTTVEYIGGLMQGVVSFIDLPTGEKLTKQLADWSRLAFECMPEKTRAIDPAALAGNPIPRKVGDPSPIKYVIYIVKENRTYDQVLGDLEKGNGEPSLCLFGEDVTPNHHALANEFVVLDNFYVESEVSADGHEWTCGAIATDFVEKTWPMGYGHGKKYPYPSEGHFPIAIPAGGYLWDRAAQAKVSYRSYGEFVENGKTPADPSFARLPALKGHFDSQFRGFDLDYPDAKRADRFISELQRFEREGEMPRLQILRLPNDHTSGTSPKKPTPTAYLADNDHAFGRVIEALSKSKFWAKTAVFVVEDDAQNGSDHIDAHRTIAFAISPYIKRGSVDSTLYSTSSMLRTIELILGLRPMSQFDAAAMPMFASFQGTPDLKEYTARTPKANETALNTFDSWGARESLAMNFKKEDAADDLLLNEVIWRSVRGAESAMPAPRRAAFVYTKRNKADKDDD
jgi:YVTN family beta-propeller protein